MDLWSQPASQYPEAVSRGGAAPVLRLDSSISAVRELITSVISTDDSSYMLIQRCTLHFVSGQYSHCEASSLVSRVIVHESIANRLLFYLLCSVYNSSCCGNRKNNFNTEKSLESGGSVELIDMC